MSMFRLKYRRLSSLSDRRDDEIAVTPCGNRVPSSLALSCSNDWCYTRCKTERKTLSRSGHKKKRRGLLGYSPLGYRARSIQQLLSMHDKEKDNTSLLVVLCRHTYVSTHAANSCWVN
ncbi:hypothetical protein EAI_11236 [Harpegnathos saltator]|uniref:Uncharacterized protein n=1 Tax=Harpegnathos saltator TaxID=610380 RepID=E2BMD3_HARSA|nr:hypothetical protein EAI_11236 [Harpegnathos saltator]